jgi:hypothetical protein
MPPGGMTMMHPQHHHPSQPPASSTTTIVLLTNVPACLHHPRAVRDWIVSCGNARSVMLVPPPPKPKRSKAKKSLAASDGNKDSAVEEADDNDDESDDDDDDEEEDRDLVPSSKLPTVTGLVTMSHPEAAVRFVAAFKSFHAKLVSSLPSDDDDDDDSSKNKNSAETKKFAAHLVPLSNPEIPLPPLAAGLDPAVVEALGKQLHKNYQNWKSGERNHLLAGYWGTAQHQNDSAEPSATNEATSTSSLPQKRTRNYLDDDDDDDDDDDMPSNEHLKSPEVRQAVQAFRRKIERLNTTKSSRRKQIVLERVSAMLPKVRDRVQRELERERNPPNVPPPGLAPPQPAGPHGMMMMNMPPPPPPTGQAPPAAPRGVSNLPAWMTASAQQQQQLAPTAAAAASKLDAALLRTFVSSQIQKYLGEDEPTLGEFVVRKVLEVVGGSTSAAESSSDSLPERIRTALLPDLKDVLDEDSDAFMEAVVSHVQSMLLQE